MTSLLAHYRKRVETAGSQIERLLPKHWWRQLVHPATWLEGSVNEKVPFGPNREVPVQTHGQLHQINIGKATICQQYGLAMEREQTTGFFQDRLVLVETDTCTAMFQDFPC